MKYISGGLPPAREGPAAEGRGRSRRKYTLLRGAVLLEEICRGSILTILSDRNEFFQAVCVMQ